MTRKHPVIIAAALAIPFVVSARAEGPPPVQNTPSVKSVQGTVVGPSNEPQAGVPVQIEGPPGKTIAVTDNNGTWTLYNLPAGQYQVKAIDAQQTAPVTFSVKEKSFWERVLGSSKNVVSSPEIRTLTAK